MSLLPAITKMPPSPVAAMDLTIIRPVIIPCMGGIAIIFSLTILILCSPISPRLIPSPCAKQRIKAPPIKTITVIVINGFLMLMMRLPSLET